MYQQHLKDEKLESDTEFMEKLAADYKHPAVEVMTDVRQLAKAFAEADVFDHEHSVPEWPLGAKYDGTTLINCDFNDPAAVYRGKLDRVEVHEPMSIVWDWKTSWAMLSPAQMDANIQAKMYAVLWFAAQPSASAVRVNFWYVRWNSIRYRDYNRDELDLMIDDLEHFREIRNEAIKKNKWEPVPCSKCKWCEFQCPLKTKLVKASAFLVPRKPEDVKELVNALTIVKAAEAQLTDLIKFWAEEHGPVAGDRTTYGFTKKDSTSYPLDRMLAEMTSPEFLTSLGLDPADGKPAVEWVLEVIKHWAVHHDLSLGKLNVGKLGTYLKAKKRADLKEHLANSGVASVATTTPFGEL
jgi:hypothetical protein